MTDAKMKYRLPGYCVAVAEVVQLMDSHLAVL